MFLIVENPGWNDPPMLNYTSSNPPPKSRISNKRVAFPLSQNSTVPPLASGAVQNHNTTGDIPGTEVPNWNPEESLALIVNNFEKLLENDESAKLKNLGSNLEMLKAMWLKGELPEEAQKYLLDISKFLCENNSSKANELQLHLAMKYGTVCSSWISLITHFINRK